MVILFSLACKSSPLTPLSAFCFPLKERTFTSWLAGIANCAILDLRGFEPEFIPLVMLAQRLVGLMAHWRESMGMSSVTERQ